MSAIEHSPDSSPVAMAGEPAAKPARAVDRPLHLRVTGVLRGQRDHLVRFLRLVHEDWMRHGRDSSLAGFRALLVYRFGVWQLGLRPSVIRFPFRIMYSFLYRYVRNHYGIELYQTVKIGRRFWMAHQSGIVIHPHAVFGDDCLIRQNVTVGAVSFNRVSQAPRIGNRVEIGCGAAILGPVTIGDDTRIGANVVVMTDIPPGSTVVASPPRVIRLSNHQSDSTSENGSSSK